MQKQKIMPLLCAVLIGQNIGGRADEAKRAAAPDRTKKTDNAPQKNTPLLIQSAIACYDSTDSKITLLDVALTGTTQPSLKADGTHLTLVLPRSLPDKDLPAHVASGGAITRIELETPTRAQSNAAFHIELREAMQAEIVPGPTAQTVRVRLTGTAAGAKSPEAVRPAGSGLYDIDAAQSNVADLLQTLAQDEGASVVLASAVTAKVTVSLKQKSFVQALDLLTKSAGLAYHQDGTTFVVGAPKDIETAFPKPEPVKPQPPTVLQKVYRCRHISAADLVTTLTNRFDKADLRVILGASSVSPRLEDAKTAGTTGTDSNIIKSGAATGAEPGLASKDVILYGDPGAVALALELAKMLDVRRRQVRIEVKIVDISLNALQDLGIKWLLPNYNVHEVLANGINFGTFTHDPISIGASLAADETAGNSKLLAAPNLTMLDGERSFILIGDRLSYPVVNGYTQAQTPIISREEQRVGIYVQFATQIDETGEITLTVYPQVSTITSYLNINGGSYPQISTREQQTTVRIKSGEQMIIGGLIRNDEIKNIERVPGLSKIPILGDLFTYRHTTKNKSDVVIMLRPILTDD